MFAVRSVSRMQVPEVVYRLQNRTEKLAGK